MHVSRFTLSQSQKQLTHVNSDTIVDCTQLDKLNQASIQLTVIRRPNGVSTASNREITLCVRCQGLDNRRYILGTLGLNDAVGLQLRRHGKVRLSAGLVAVTIGVVYVLQTLCFK